MQSHIISPAFPATFKYLRTPKNLRARNPHIKMSLFLSSVKALKIALDVPSDMPLAPAIHYMMKIMRLPVTDDDGQPLALPDLVDVLLEKTGLNVTNIGSDMDANGSNGIATDAAVATPKPPPNDANLKQSEPHTAY